MLLLCHGMLDLLSVDSGTEDQFISETTVEKNESESDFGAL